MTYAGQNKVAKEIERKVKVADAEKQSTKDKKNKAKKIYYYNKLRKNNPNTIMKSILTPAIDVINVTYRKTEIGKVYTSEYWDENFDGENNVTMEISEEALLTHVAQFYTNGDGCFISDKDFLAENLDEIIKDYITANSLR